jgi:hypothetical protein
MVSFHARQVSAVNWHLYCISIYLSRGYFILGIWWSKIIVDKALLEEPNSTDNKNGQRINLNRTFARRALRSHLKCFCTPNLPCWCRFLTPIPPFEIPGQFKAIWVAVDAVYAWSLSINIITSFLILNFDRSSWATGSSTVDLLLGLIRQFSKRLQHNLPSTLSYLVDICAAEVLRLNWRKNWYRLVWLWT